PPPQRPNGRPWRCLSRNRPRWARRSDRGAWRSPARAARDPARPPRRPCRTATPGTGRRRPRWPPPPWLPAASRRSKWGRKVRPGVDGPCCGAPDDGAVGDGVGERDGELEAVDALLVELQHEPAHHLEGWIARVEEQRQAGAAAAALREDRRRRARDRRAG